MRTPADHSQALVRFNEQTDGSSVICQQLNDIDLGIDRMEQANGVMVQNVQGSGARAGELAQTSLNAFIDRGVAARDNSKAASHRRFAALDAALVRERDTWQELGLNMQCVSFDMPREEVENHFTGMNQAIQARSQASAGMLKGNLAAIDHVMQSVHHGQMNEISRFSADIQSRSFDVFF